MIIEKESLAEATFEIKIDKLKTERKASKRA